MTVHKSTTTPVIPQHIETVTPGGANSATARQFNRPLEALIAQFGPGSRRWEIPPEDNSQPAFDADTVHTRVVDNNLATVLQEVAQTALTSGKELFLEVNSSQSDGPLLLRMHPVQGGNGDGLDRALDQIEYRNSDGVRIPVEQDRAHLPLINGRNPVETIEGVESVRFAVRGYPSQLDNASTLSDAIAAMDSQQASAFETNLKAFYPISSIQSQHLVNVVNGNDTWRVFDNSKDLYSDLAARGIQPESDGTLIIGRRNDGGLVPLLARDGGFYTANGGTIQQDSSFSVMNNINEWYVVSMENLPGLIPQRNFSGQDLQNVDFWSANLSGANFKEVDLRNANLDGVRLLNANFDGADLRGTTLYGAELSGATFRGAVLDEGVLMGMGFTDMNAETDTKDLSEPSTSEVDIRGADLRYVGDLEGINLRGVDLEGVILSPSQLESWPMDERAGVSLGGVMLQHDVGIVNTDEPLSLRGVSMGGFDLEGFFFDGIQVDAYTIMTADNPSEMNLRGADARGVDLSSVRRQQPGAQEETPQEGADVMVAEPSDDTLDTYTDSMLPKDLHRLRVDNTTLRTMGDLSLYNMSSLDLSEADLSFMDLSELNLGYINLQGSDLSNTNLSRTNLSAVNLQDANLTNTTFTAASLVGANLTGVNGQGANFMAANLSHSNLKGANLTFANFRLADLHGADVTNAVTTEDLSTRGVRKGYGADDLKIMLARITGGNFDHVNFDNVDASEVLPDNADPEGIEDLGDLDLSGLDLRGADLAGANLTAAKLNSANLQGVDLHTALLTAADLRGADLTGANMSHAEMSFALLDDAKLEGADLSFSTVSGGSFLNVDLSTTHLNGIETNDIVLNTNDQLYTVVDRQSDVTDAATEIQSAPPAEPSSNDEINGIGPSPDINPEGDQGPQSILRPGGNTPGTGFSTTPFGTIDPALNPNGLIDSSRGTQSGVDGNGGRGNAPTAVAAPGDENPFSNNIPEAGAILPQIPNVIVPGGWQMPAPGELLNGVFIPDTAPAPEDATSQSSAGEGPSISYTPNGEAGGVTIGGQLGSPGEAEKANTEMEQLLGKGSRQGVRPDLFPTPIDNRIPGFGEGVPPADANSNDTSWGLPDEPITLPESEGFPEKDPVLDNILNPNGVGRPQFTFPPIKEGSRIPEVPAEAQAALTKALPELQGIRYAQFSQLSAADQQQVIPRTLAYQQLAPNDKTNISLIEYLDSGKTSEPQRQQLSQLNAAQTVHQAQLNTVEARTGLDSSSLELINARINALQANTAQINQQTQSIQQSNAARLSTLATQAQADPVGVAFIKPESTPQGTSESRPEIKAPISQNSAPIPRFMVVRTENGPKLIENLANGQSQLHAYPLSADTPITRQESNGAWSGVPDVGQIGSRLFLDLLFTNGALKMLNNGNPVQAPGGATQQPPVNGTPQAPTGIPQPAF